jgi:hypothetical protein
MNRTSGVVERRAMTTTIVITYVLMSAFLVVQRVMRRGDGERPSDDLGTGSCMYRRAMANSSL